MPTSSLPISAYVICKNEALLLPGCLDSLEAFRDIVVVDSGSTDGTLDIVRDYQAKGFPIRLFHNDWPGYARQKQFALDQTREAWRLNIDADERLDDELKFELGRLIETPADVAAWRIPYRQHLFGYGPPPKAVVAGHLLRLVREGHARYRLDALVHEGMAIDGRIRTAPRGAIIHVRALPVGEQILKENGYSTLKAEQLFRNGRKPSLLKLLFNPPFYFLKLYFVRGFLLCGRAGFVHAMTAATYAFLTEAKLFEREAENTDEPRA